MKRKSATIRWINYGLALSVLLLNIGFLLPVTVRELGAGVPYSQNQVLRAAFNCNLLLIPAAISLLKGYAYYAGWLMANGISLLLCIYVYYLLIITVNAM